MKAKWRFIDSNNRSPYYNMALDEALLEWHSKGEIPPTIRFTDGTLQRCRSVIFKKLKKKLTLIK